MARKKKEIIEQEEQKEELNEVQTTITDDSSESVEKESATEDLKNSEDNSNKKIDIKKLKLKRLSFKELYEKIQENLPLMICTCIFSFILVALVALAVFFTSVEGYEKVLVPDVTGKKLENGLLEMQAKELYPTISLRYSETPGDEGTIMDQNPKAGAIVRGYSKVSLVVSRGVIADRVGNYVGIKLDEMRINLQTLFAGSAKPLILIGDISYKPDASEAGTILEQDPPEGTSISDPVVVNLIVSRGPQYDNTKPPYLKGMSINDLLQTITRSKMIFDFTGHTAGPDETPGTVVSHQTFEEEFVPNYTRMSVDIALPDRNFDGNVYGVFASTLDIYPWAVPMRLDAVPLEGNPYTIISFNHPGGLVTLPYAVAPETELILYVDNKAKAKEMVH
ncbi:MAG: PASTA domain-containing protein [Treponema sp.]|nr:PASTA domain-containing protein [Treponema sp.]